MSGYPPYPPADGAPYPPAGGAPYPPPGGAPYPPPGQPGFAPPAMYPPGQPGYPPAPGYPPPGGAPGYPPPGGAPGYPPPEGYPPYQGGPPPIVQPPAPGGAPGANYAPSNPAQGAYGTGVTAGLEYLAAIDQLIIKQKVELIEAFIGFETNNKYSVKNSLGQKIFSAEEKNDCCTRMCCGSARPFDMKIYDNVGNTVLRMSRPLRCQSCWFPCFLQRMEVFSSNGNVIGYVVQEWSILAPKFTIRDPQENVVLRIEGPICTSSLCCSDVEFEVISASTGHNVGKISKQWTGLLREAFTDADNFGVSFPLDLHVDVKATLMAATFLIDFMFFEKSGNKENDRPGMFD